LAIELGGTEPGEFDTLDVGGTATLAGALVVTEIGGFVAVPGNSFVILTASDIVDEFDNVSLPTDFEVIYTDTRVVARLPLFGDVNGDGQTDLKDYGTFQVCFGGPGSPPAAACPPLADGDWDDDGDVDLDDYVLIATVLTGPMP